MMEDCIFQMVLELPACLEREMLFGCKSLKIDVAVSSEDQDWSIGAVARDLQILVRRMVSQNR